LKDFTAETKGPFMMPEIVEKLAAMLDYNLDALVGPKCGELKVQDPEKYKFSPRQLLSDILQVYINLSDQEEFVRAVASDGRSYRKELFMAAMERARRVPLKTETEIEVLRLFVENVEEMKATIEAEEDLGEIPDEFLGRLLSCFIMGS
jgi:ubiquitin conjugation factor E4 B